MYKYNLILFHVPKRQGISDFLTVKNIMVGRAPDIQVHVISAAPVPDSFWQVAAARPTLLFSPVALHSLDTRIRGTRMVSETVTKLEELARIAATGAPVPETHLITKTLRLDEAQWGPFTVIKPNLGMRGQGVSLVRTRDVRWIDTGRLPKSDPRHGDELLAQRFVDTGPCFICYRVFTVLGRPIYCMTSTALDERAALDAGAPEPLDAPVAANGLRRKLELVNDREVIDLAMSVHAGLPHLPVMGLDIIREASTGRLFVLEYNSTGGVWHLSSDHGLGHQKDHALDYYAQFDALNTITNALIEATRKCAV